MIKLAIAIFTVSSLTLVAPLSAYAQNDSKPYPDDRGSGRWERVDQYTPPDDMDDLEDTQGAGTR